MLRQHKRKLMPKRREGPVLNTQRDVYYFDQFVGIGAERRRVRVSLGTRDLARATWLWEQEFKRRWSEYYGIKSVKPAAPARFASLIPEFIAFEREVKRAATWKTFEKRLEIVASIWGDIALGSISRPQPTAPDKALREGGVPAQHILKVSEGRPNVVDWMKNRAVHLIINTPSGQTPRRDEVSIRTTAVLRGVPLITTVPGAAAAASAIEALRAGRFGVRPLQSWHGAPAPG